MGRLPIVKTSAELDRPQAGDYNTYEIALISGRALLGERTVARFDNFFSYRPKVDDPRCPSKGWRRIRPLDPAVGSDNQRDYFAEWSRLSRCTLCQK